MTSTGFSNFDRALLYRILAGQEDLIGMISDQAITIAAIGSKEDAILQQEITLASDLSQLAADVAADTTVDQAAATLLSGLSGMLSTAIAALPDPTQLQSLHTQLESNVSALQAAVTANTPAAPPPPPPPPPPGP